MSPGSFETLPPKEREREREQRSICLFVFLWRVLQPDKQHDECASLGRAIAVAVVVVVVVVGPVDHDK